MKRRLPSRVKTPQSRLECLLSFFRPQQSNSQNCQRTSYLEPEGLFQRLASRPDLRCSFYRDCPSAASVPKMGIPHFKEPPRIVYHNRLLDPSGNRVSRRSRWSRAACLGRSLRGHNSTSTPAPFQGEVDILTRMPGFGHQIPSMPPRWTAGGCGCPSCRAAPAVSRPESSFLSRHIAVVTRVEPPALGPRTTGSAQGWRRTTCPGRLPRPSERKAGRGVG